MDANTIAIVVAIAGVGAVLTGIGVTLLIFLFRGFFRLGQLFQRMDAQDENIRQIREDLREMRDDIRQLRDDIGNLTAAINRRPTKWSSPLPTTATTRTAISFSPGRFNPEAE